MHSLAWTMTDVENLKSVTVQRSINGTQFSDSRTLANSGGTKDFTATEPSTYSHFRLKIVNADNSVFYSPVIKANKAGNFSVNKIGPNPAKNFIQVDLMSPQSRSGYYTILNQNGSVALQGKIQLQAGNNTFTLSTTQLPAGIYQLNIQSVPADQPISFRFVKQ
jgi:hypothetical protein